MPDDIWFYIRGQGVSWDEVKEGTLPWNRRKRGRLEGAQGGVVVHLFSGNENSAHPWKDLETKDVEIFTIDTSANSCRRTCTIQLCGHTCCSSRPNPDYLVWATSRTVSRMRHQRPGPKPLRGRGSLRFRLEDLGGGDLCERMATHHCI